MSNRGHKLVIVGNDKSGKTCLRYKLVDGYFEDRYVPTLAIETNIYEFEGERIEIWDTAGKQQFQGLKEGYYVGGDLFLVMFDLNDHASFTSIDHWIDKIRKTCGDVPIILCGNKSDIARVEQVFIDHKVEEINQNPNFGKKICYVPISIKNNDNIDILNHQILSYLKP